MQRAKTSRAQPVWVGQAWGGNRLTLVYRPSVSQPGFIDTSSHRESEEGGDRKMSDWPETRCALEQARDLT